jgi:hypothetical protein
MIDVVEGREQISYCSFVGDVERYPASAATEMVERADQPTLIASDDRDPSTCLLRHRGGGQSDAGRPPDHHHFGILE